MKSIKIIAIILFLSITNLFSNEKPFILVSNSAGTIAEKLEEVKTILKNNEFEIVGEYSPFNLRHVLIFTNESLKKDAAKTKFGAYGASLRISFTEIEGIVQVAFTNPNYWNNAYRMEGEPEKMKNLLSKILGNEMEFGSKKGVSIKKLRKYHYMMTMPYFDDQNEIAKFESYEEALKQIEKGLSEKKNGTGKVYRIDIPNKKETVFGISLTSKSSNDEVIMNKIDKGELKHTAHLCYEMIVSDNNVFALDGKFRIAISFPDLSMGLFTKIINAPGDIKDALKKVAEQ